MSCDSSLIEVMRLEPHRGHVTGVSGTLNTLKIRRRAHSTSDRATRGIGPDESPHAAAAVSWARRFLLYNTVPERIINGFLWRPW